MTAKMVQVSFCQWVNPRYVTSVFEHLDRREITVNEGGSVSHVRTKLPMDTLLKRLGLPTVPMSEGELDGIMESETGSGKYCPGLGRIVADCGEECVGSVCLRWDRGVRPGDDE